MNLVPLGWFSVPQISYNLKYKLYILQFLSHITHYEQCCGYFSQNLQSSFFPDGYFTLSQLYLFLKGKRFDIIWEVFFGFFITKRNCRSILNALIIFFEKIDCCFLVFYPVNRINIWTTTVKIYFRRFV